MKLTRTVAFNDGLLAQYCSLVEQLILSADETAAAEGIRLTDSAVKSALVKAVNLLRNRPPKNTGASPKDLLLTKLTGTVIGLREQVEAVPVEPGEEAPAIHPTRDEWEHTLTAIIQSIETRMSGEAGGRNYLEFLPGFFKSVPRRVALPA
jgi:hypothetical protein